jgi:hypothetical protein
MTHILDLVQGSMTSNLLDLIHGSMAHFERLDLRVGRIWLNPVQADELENAPMMVFDRICDPYVRRASPGIRGALFGVTVYASDLVPPMHIAILPDGFDGKLVDSAACFPLMA